MIKDIVIGGTRLKVKHIQVEKDKPTIIFLHDSLGCIELWRDFPEKLGEATKCNVLVYDRQGYGKSSPFTSRDRKSDYMEIEADVLNLLMEQCGIDRAILFGHSDGGTISLIAGAKYPSKIMGIITEGAHIFVEDITLEGIKEAIQTYQTTNLKERLEKYHGNKADALFWAWAATWLNAEYRSWNIDSFLLLIKCPVLVIQGENDEYGSLAQVNGIINAVSGKTTELIIPGIGHTPHRDAQLEVLHQSIEYISKLR
jgi:pimeloyl-ACP methyl ester carboxylesterase